MFSLCHLRCILGVRGDAELEFISHRSCPRAVLPVAAGKVFITHPWSGLGTAGTPSALCQHSPHPGAGVGKIPGGDTARPADPR